MRFAWGLWVAALLLTAAAIAFAVATPDGFWVGPAVGFVAFPVALGGAGLLIARRGNNTGWVLLVGMLLYGVQAVTASYADFALPDGRPGALVVAWIASWVFVPLLGVIVALFYTFPDGRLPEGRWRAVAIVGAVGFVLLTLATPFTSERLAENEPVSVLNPLNPYYIGDDLPWIGFASSVGGLLFLLGGLLGGSASLISRYRRSSGERRYQIKWFAFAGAVLAASMVVTIALDALGVAAPVGEWLFAVGVFTMPVAIAIALFKYRLYEIDLVIRRTVVYAGLAGFIGVLYISIVAGVGALVGSGDEPNLALSVAATAIVAVAFQPARERLTTFANRLVFGKRATPYEVLSRFSSHLGETVATDETLERMAQLLSEGTGADHAQVSLDIDGQLRVGAVWPPDRRAEDDPEHLVEVVHEGERLGALSLAKPPGEELTPQDERLMADLASQAGLVLRNVRLTEQLRAKLEDLRRSRQRLVSAQDDERRRLERDLHDGAQQQFVAVKMKASVTQRLLEQELGPEARATQMVAALVADTDAGVQTLRELAHGIYPPLLAAEGLPAALRSQARRAAVPVTVETNGVGRYPEDVEAAIYFCVLEAVNNAAKYADPDHVAVRLTERNGTVGFEVTDDGVGYDTAAVEPGHGLTNMADRLDALGGTLGIISVPGSGTTVQGNIPTAVPADS